MFTYICNTDIRFPVEYLKYNTKDYVEDFIPWGQHRGKEKNNFVITLKNNKNIVAYAIIGHNENGIIFQEYSFKNIKYVIEWLEVKKEHQKKGYGAILVNHIKELFYSQQTPICLYAKEFPYPTTSFYYKLGAIILFDDEDDIIHDRFLAFMKLDKLEMFFKEGIQSTTKFEITHSNRKICGAIHEIDGENIKCDKIWKNDDIQCQDCLDYLT